MAPNLDQWKIIEIAHIQEILGEFKDWALCGGRSIDWLVGKSTREHGDTDIGIFRSDVARCLNSICGLPVYLCDPPGKVVEWNGQKVPDHVRDIWVADNNNARWLLQLMIYDDSQECVFYRNDDKMSWAKRHHAITVNGIKTLNPFITMLYKTRSAKPRNRDHQDISRLIEWLAITGPSNVD